ncbi:MAG: DUF5668 domain-containing protein [Bacteroidales bacterium]|nr:DUF5668 domain-containing protein [Bacteroidales bacterium]
MKDKNHKPGRSFGIFLVLAGLFLAGFMFDVLSLGNFREYFIWPMLLIFIGVFSIFTENAAAGIILIAIGGYFFLRRIDFELPEIYEKLYWPAAIILAGLTLIISGIVRRYRRN